MHSTEELLVLLICFSSSPCVLGEDGWGTAVKSVTVITPGLQCDSELHITVKTIWLF